MTTGTVIVQDSLRQIGAHSLVAPAPAEALDIGFRNLNAMVHGWLTRNIKLGISPLEAVGDELHETPDVYWALITNLAITLAPNYDSGKNVVSQTLRANASISFQLVKNAYLDITIPSKVVSATLPRGQGARIWWTDSIFFGAGAKIEDGETN